MKTMEDTLDNLLAALNEKYPHTRVEINEAALRPAHIQLPAESATFADLRSLVQDQAPQMLQNTAHILEENHEGEIFILDYAENEHIFAYHY